VSRDLIIMGPPLSTGVSALIGFTYQLGEESPVESARSQTLTSSPFESPTHS
jgi:hypothetical protein